MSPWPRDPHQPQQTRRLALVTHRSGVALACRYFNPPDEEGEDYKGGRDLESLRKFASTELGPGCSVDAMENCDDAQKKELEKYIAMPAADRDAKLAERSDGLALAPFRVEGFSLFRSELNPSGAVYTSLADFPLGRSAEAGGDSGGTAG